MRAFENRGISVGALLISLAIGAALAALAPHAVEYRVIDAEPDGDPIALTDDDEESELALAAAMPAAPEISNAAFSSAFSSADGWSEVAPAEGSASMVQALAAPVSGAPDNPFSNTCDGRAIGFVNAAGEKPRMEFRKVPAGAVLECRTGPAATITKAAFGPCDGGKGTGPVHTPALAAEGRHRTEVRYRVKGASSATMGVSYYVHRSLDRAACCTASAPDAAWFTAAQTAFKPAGAFDASVSLDNPAIVINVASGKTVRRKSLLSLRRTFRLSPDRRLLLIRRTMASRRTFERTKKNSCAGVSIAVPKYGIAPRDKLDCKADSMSPYRGPGALIQPKCPSIYCTVTSCVQTSPACTEVRHTFYRGPGQKPWVGPKPLRRCADESVLSLTPRTCDAYVLNQKGDGVCLVSESGKIRAAATIDARDSATGLMLLGEQPDPASKRAHYVFSAKTTWRTGVENILYLPQ